MRHEQQHCVWFDFWRRKDCGVEFVCVCVCVCMQACVGVGVCARKQLTKLSALPLILFIPKSTSDKRTKPCSQDVPWTELKQKQHNQMRAGHQDSAHFFGMKQTIIKTFLRARVSKATGKISHKFFCPPIPNTINWPFTQLQVNATSQPNSNCPDGSFGLSICFCF